MIKESQRISGSEVDRRQSGYYTIPNCNQTIYIWRVVVLFRLVSGVDYYCKKVPLVPMIIIEYRKMKKL